MTLDGLVFDNVLLYPFVDGIVRDKAYVLPHIFYVVIIIIVVKGDVFKVISRGHTKNWIVLCESHQDWF